MVDVVCPQCTSVVRAQPGTVARCGHCGYSGGTVPGHDQVQVFAPPEQFLPTNPYPQEGDDEDEDEEQQKPKVNSGAAVAAMVIGFASILLPPGGPVAIGFGIAGIAQVNKSPDELKGKGLATVGIIFGALSMAVWALLIISGAALIGSFLP